MSRYQPSHPIHNNNFQMKKAGRKPSRIRIGLMATALAGSVGVLSASVNASAATKAPARRTRAASKQVVTFWEFQTDTPSINAFKASIKSFEASHPGITIDMSIVPWSEQAQKLTTAIATGGLPDVSMLGNDIVAEYVAEHELLPLKVTDPQDITPGDKLYYHLQGKWWAVPLIDETRAIIYNKNLFRQAGISSPPETWAEMKADALKIKQKTGDVGWALPMAKNVYNTVQNFMSVYLSYGARYLTPSGACGFDTPQFKTALSYYTSIYKDGSDAPDATVEQDAQLQALFTAGKAGMIQENESFLFELKTTNPALYKQLGVVPIPAGPKGRFGFLGGWPLVVWKSAAVSHVQQAAEAFAEYVGSPSGGDITLAKATGLIPANIAAANHAPWNQPPIELFQKQVMTDAYPYQYPHAEIPQMGALETDTVQTAVQSVALGTASVNSATQTLCSAINSATGK